MYVYRYRQKLPKLFLFVKRRKKTRVEYILISRVSVKLGVVVFRNLALEEAYLKPLYFIPSLKI